MWLRPCGILLRVIARAVHHLSFLLLFLQRPYAWVVPEITTHCMLIVDYCVFSNFFLKRIMKYGCGTLSSLLSSRYLFKGLFHLDSFHLLNRKVVLVVHCGWCTLRATLLISEYMTGGSLYNYLHKYRRLLDLSEVLKFAIDVAKGMEYLHGSNIIHRDLKTANLLMDNRQVSILSCIFGVLNVLNFSRWYVHLP